MVRAVGGVLIALITWWCLLKEPSLWLLRTVAYIPLSICLGAPGHPVVRVEPGTGDWYFNVIVNTVATHPKTGERQLIGSIEFLGDRENVAFFAVGWFTYLALALSAGAWRRSEWRRLAWGFAAQTVIAIASFIVYLYVNGHGAALGQEAGDRSNWMLHYGYYLVYLVVPFAAPFAVAIAAHPAWRAYFLPPAPPPPEPVTHDPQPRRTKRTASKDRQRQA